MTKRSKLVKKVPRVSAKYGPVVTLERAKKVLENVDAGLIGGIGNGDLGSMCVEQAVASAFGEGDTDRPKCVEPWLADMKIELNDDLDWESDDDRADGLRRVAIAQLGSKGRLNEEAFKAELRKVTEARILEELDVGPRLAKLAKKPTVDDLREFAEDMSDDLPDPHDHANMPGLQKVLRDDQKGLMVYAELMVGVLKKFKVPGTKFLYLTEPKKVGKRKATKKSKAKRRY